MREESGAGSKKQETPVNNRQKHNLKSQTEDKCGRQVRREKSVARRGCGVGGDRIQRGTASQEDGNKLVSCGEQTQASRVWLADSET